MSLDGRHALGEEQVAHGHDRLLREVHDQVGVGVQARARDEDDVGAAGAQGVAGRQRAPGPSLERLGLAGERKPCRGSGQRSPR